MNCHVTLILVKRRILHSSFIEFLHVLTATIYDAAQWHCTLYSKTIAIFNSTYQVKMYFIVFLNCVHYKLLLYCIMRKRFVTSASYGSYGCFVNYLSVHKIYTKMSVYRLQPASTSPNCSRTGSITMHCHISSFDTTAKLCLTALRFDSVTRGF